jgi:hypothetical protein
MEMYMKKKSSIVRSLFFHRARVFLDPIISFLIFRLPSSFSSLRLILLSYCHHYRIGVGIGRGNSSGGIGGV